MKKYQLPEAVKKIMKKLENAGFQAWLVGGCVRDLLMDRPVKDWDFATNATPEEILKLFPGSFYNNRFGTVSVPAKVVNQKTKVKSKEKKESEDNSEKTLSETAVEKHIFEITTFRQEHGYLDRRHPDKISWGKSIEEDLSRRDFTVNAIAYNLKRFVDPFNGQQDIKKKIIRAVGVAQTRFQEDALRLIRAIRFATQLKFIIEESTFKAIKENASLINEISKERVRDELMKIIASEHPADGVMLLRNSGLLAYILPELDQCFGIPQQSPKRHHIYDVGTHCVKSLENVPSTDPIVRLATLLHDIGKKDTFKRTAEGVITFYNHEIVGAKLVYRIARRLRFSKKETTRLCKLVRWHQFTVDERQTDSAIRRFIRKVGKENLDDILALRIGDRLGGGAGETSWRLELFKKRLAEVQKQPFTVHDLKVNGHDVMRILNIPPGPLVGEVLKRLFAEVEEDKNKNKREYLLKRIREMKKELNIS